MKDNSINFELLIIYKLYRQKIKERELICFKSQELLLFLSIPFWSVYLYLFFDEESIIYILNSYQLTIADIIKVVLFFFHFIIFISYISSISFILLPFFTIFFLLVPILVFLSSLFFSYFLLCFYLFSFFSLFTLLLKNISILYSQFTVFSIL